jgi:SRSO17 transposase
MLSHPGTLLQMRSEIQQWMSEFDRLMQRMGHQFGRVEAKQRLSEYVQGLLSPIERKNGWQLSEQCGDETPYGIQHLLNRSTWSADDMRDDMRDYVIEQMGDPEAVLVLDETGFLKKGKHSIGVQRQYSGTAGRVENCQIGVFLVYATAKGQTFLDRELYLPKSWSDNRARCQAAHVPHEREFFTKPQLARQMLERTLAAEVPFQWVTGDSVYGSDARLREFLEQQKVSYVLEVACDQSVVIKFEKQRIDQVIAQLDSTAWSRVSAGKGEKGERWYDWTAIATAHPEQSGWQRWCIARRCIDQPDEIAYFLAFVPMGTALETVVRVAGTRWTVEICFQTAKGEVGLDQYEVRTWQGWYRHITLSCLAHAFLSVIRIRQLDAEKGGIASNPFFSFKHRLGR